MNLLTSPFYLFNLLPLKEIAFFNEAGILIHNISSDLNQNIGDYSSVYSFKHPNLLWIGTSIGLHQFHFYQNHFSTLSFTKKGSIQIDKPSCRKILRTHQGDLVVCSESGIWSKKLQQKGLFFLENEQSSVGSKAIIEDQFSNLWSGNQGYLIKHYPNGREDKYDLNSFLKDKEMRNIWSLYLHKNGQIMVGGIGAQGFF